MSIPKPIYPINPDIQILRGLSILIVLLYHLNVTAFQSGYLGVDIFFVISGFLMGKLYADIASIKDTITFYKKRLNRILPAYYVTLFITLIAAAFLVLPHEFKDISRHGIFSFLLAPNVGFWGDASYFESRFFKPFLNFWSLGVEIHFYLIFPLVAFVFRRVVWLVLIGAIGSLILCYLIADISPKTSFFMMPLRFWEFMAGFLVAKIEIRNVKRWMSSLALLALIITIGLSTLSFSQSDHLKYAAPLVTLLSLIILLMQLPSQISESIVGKTLQTLGKYSYSIYLVHFPIIALVLYQPYSGLNLNPETMTDTALILSLTVATSIVMFHIVETPFRKNMMKQFWAPAYVIFAVIGFLITPFLIQQSRVQYTEAQLKVFDAWQDRTEYRCGKLRRITQPKGASCSLTENEKAEKSYLLVGNSHADSLKETLVSLATKANAELHMMKSDCSLGKGACRPDALFEEAKVHNIDTIIIHSSFGQVTAESMNKLLSVIGDESLNVIYILPVPRWSFHVPQTLYERGIDSIWDHEQQTDLRAYEKSTQEEQKDILAIRSPHFKTISVGKTLCVPLCQIMDEQEAPLYYDAHHLTLTGSEKTAPALKAIFENL